MGKYNVLTEHLRAKGGAKVAMSFTDIERLLGFPLPASSRKHRAWWSNNPSNSVMTKAWLDAQYRSAEVDLEHERLMFIKLNETAPDLSGRAQGYYPMFSALSGTLTVSPGFDLTDPADPELAAGNHEDFSVYESAPRE
jgi:hypothetical protein